MTNLSLKSSLTHSNTSLLKSPSVPPANSTETNTDPSDPVSSRYNSQNTAYYNPSHKIIPHARRPIKANIHRPWRLSDTLQIIQQPHLAVHMHGHGVRRQGMSVPGYDALQYGVWIDELQVLRVENGFGDDVPLGDGSRVGMACNDDSWGLDGELHGKVISKVWRMGIADKRVDASVEIFDFVQVLSQRKWPMTYYKSWRHTMWTQNNSPPRWCQYTNIDHPSSYRIIQAVLQARNILNHTRYACNVDRG